ncbi:putative T7SS-secreted protein [uncultured Williamsia sp.]|uniref:putative T7SS-secreted protein n=1 Tax=uncultured Williamsia sp. TaxID=259311 RepID=UPI002618AA5C|nr:RNase A-like domain-containing protein [uncultured Williamsia sp.]
MGWFDDVVDTGEGLLDSGEKFLGKAVDKGTDLVGDGLRAVGLDGAADAVEDFGDSVADQLGATPEEKSLDETDDPKELVHGDPGALRDRASSLSTMAGSLNDGGSGLRGISVGDWTGEAADGYHAKTSAEFPKWFTASDACDAASGALTSLAGAVESAQQQAAEAVRLWKEAQRQHDAWLADVNRRTDAYNAAADAYNAGATDVKPTMPTFGPDPGPALKQQANDVLKRARTQRNAAASDAAGALHGAAGEAPPLPAAGDRLLDSIGDYGQAFDIAKDHFAMGFAGVATDTVKMVRTVNPFDAYNQAHPAEYLKNSTQLGAGLVHAAANPEELVKGFVGTGWSKDPAQASGALTANIMSLVAPGPKGAGALSGAGRVAGAAGRDAASAASGAARSAASAGTRDAAAAAGRGLSDVKAPVTKIGDSVAGDTRAATPSAGAPRSDGPVAARQDTAAAPAKPEPTTQPVSHRADSDTPASGDPPLSKPDADAQPGHGDHPSSDTTPGTQPKPEPDQPRPPDNGDTPAPDRDSQQGRDDTNQPVREQDPSAGRDPDTTANHPADDPTPPRSDDPSSPRDGDTPQVRDHDPSTPRDPETPQLRDHDPAPDRTPEPSARPDNPDGRAPVDHGGPAPDRPADPGATHPSAAEKADPPPVASTTPAAAHTPTAPAHSPHLADTKPVETRPVGDAPRVDSPRVDQPSPATPSTTTAAPRGDMSGRPFDSGMASRPLGSEPIGQPPGRLGDAPPTGHPAPGHGRSDSTPPAAVATKPLDTTETAPARTDPGAPTKEASAGSGDRGVGQNDHQVFDPKETLTPNGQLDRDNPNASVDRELCPRAGEPVDVATGEYFLPATDVDLPGILPLTLVRTHRSNFRGGQWFGLSWTSTLDSRLLVDADGVTTVDPDGVVLRFPPVDGDDVVVAERGALFTLQRTPVGGYVLTDGTGDRHHWFDPKPQLAGADVAAGAYTLSAITDRNRNRILFGYSDKGVPVSVEHSGGYRIAIDTVGGRVVRYRAITLDADGVTSTTLREFGYTDGDLTSSTTAVGATTRFTYDDHRIVGWVDSIGQTYENVYDPDGRVVFQTGTDGIWASRFDYRDLPDGTGSVTAVTDALGATTFYAIDVDGRPQRVADPMGRETVTRWDVRRNPISTTDPAGNTTTFDHDENGDLVRVVGPTGSTTVASYAQPGRPSRIARTDGSVETVGYDDRGNPVEYTDASGATRLLERSLNGAVTGQTDPDGRRVTVLTDTAGLPVRVEDAQGHATAVDYDAFGRPVRITAPDGAVTTRSYDLEGRLVAETAPDGGIQRWTYDGEGNRVAHVDAVGAETRWEYGYYDLPVARIEPDGTRTAFEYDRARRLAGVVNALGDRWIYEYHPDGRVAREVDFSGAETTFGYDEVGRLAWKQNGAGQRIDYRYDAAGSLVEERSGDEVVTYERDRVGRMVSAQNTFGRVEFGRDAVGRMVSESWNAAAVLSAWSAGGDLGRRSMPGGSTVTYGYDPRGALASVDIDDRSIELTVDAVGRETRRAFGTVAIDSAWDSVGRLRRRAVVDGLADAGRLNLALGPSALSENVRAASDFTYRADGALLEVVREGPATESLAPAARFGLDGAGRVHTVTDPAGQVRESFTYDANHNIARAGSPDGESGWEYRNGRLVDDGRSTYGYDGAGRVVQVVRRRLSRKPDVWRYGWDAWDRLRWVIDPSGRRWEYEYDPLGRRTAKIADDGSRVLFRWSGTQLVEQLDASTGELTSWVYAPGGLTPVAQVSGPVASRETGGLLNLAGADGDAAPLTQSEVDRRFFAIVSDQIGMPVGLLDPDSGEMAGRATTTLWGQATWTGESTPIRFPGQYADDESGLVYNLFRYYHPGSGRYLTPDPLGLAPAPNPYAYPTNPTTTADPFGLMPDGCKQDFPGGSLEAHENAGGHTIEKHVGKSDDYLRNRLGTSGVQAASTFSDLATAERAIAKLLGDRSGDIGSWLNGARRRLVLTGDVGDIVGRVLERGVPSPSAASAIRVVLDRGGPENLAYLIRTAFPVLE